MSLPTGKTDLLTLKGRSALGLENRMKSKPVIVAP
jgi:hypothetical protein